MKDVALTGFMGCGKTSVGRELVKLLPECILTDLDDRVESAAGKTIPEIFREQGESAFRALEAAELEGIFTENNDQGKRRIISLGGGTVTTDVCRRLLKEHAVCIYLKASIDTLVRNLSGDSANRPMLSNPETDAENSSPESRLKDRIEKLMDTRSESYETVSDCIIITDGKTYPQIAEEIAAMLHSGIPGIR